MKFLNYSLKIVNIIGFILISSCSTHEYSKKPRDILYQNSDTAKYFLGDLPYWANFYEKGKCRRSESIRFLNMNNLNQSFDYGYDKLLEIQIKVNQLSSQKKMKNAGKSLSLREEETIFFLAKDQVVSNIKSFKKPDFKNIHIVWIDPALSDQTYKKSLQRLLKNENFFEGHPVFISGCLSKSRLNKFISDNGWGDIDIRLISAEFFTPFNSNYTQDSKFQIHLGDLLGHNKDVSVFRLNSSEIDFINGNYSEIIVK